MILKNAIGLLLKRSDLSAAQMEAISEEILENKNPLHLGVFLSLLKAKGETREEIAGLVTGLLKKSLTVSLSKPAMDIVGTGGDGAGTINISTGSAILSAACGVPVAKHGNRAVSSLCGSGDVLEALGVKIDLSAEQVKECVEKIGIGFFFAPSFHPAMKSVAALRRELGFSTVFNLLGPLLNPAKVRLGLVGVGRKEDQNLIAESLLNLGYERALVFHGNGMDELTPLGPVQTYFLENGKFQISNIEPLEFGIPRCTSGDLRGGDRFTNARILRRILAGEKGPVADTLILNAGFALWIYGKCASPKEGIDLARQVHQTGAGLEILDRWVAMVKV